MKKSGDIIEIPLGNNEFSFARYIGNEDYAFYNLKITGQSLDIETVLKSNVLFIAVVDTYALKKGLWRIIGNAPIENSLKKVPPKYIRDVVDSNKYYIMDGDQKVQSSKEECRDLEVMASWSPEQMTDRLRDHFLGRPNKWLESIR